MTILYLALSLTAKPGQEAALRRALTDLLAPSRADEGCLLYELHTDRLNPRHFFLYEAWRDEASWRAHMATPHLQRFGEIADGFTASRALHQLDRI
jgi:quinol monooxygenase YgiN